MNVLCEYVHLISIELRKTARLYVRYPLEAALGVAFLVVIFCGAAYGLRLAPGGQGTSNTLTIGLPADGFLVGYLCWATILSGTSQLAQEIEDDAKSGVLEPLFLSAFPIVRIMLARSMCSVIAGLPVFIVLATIIVLISGQTHVLQPRVLPLVVALDVGATGLGLAIAALALTFKRVRLVLVVVQLLVVWSLVYAPSTTLPFFFVLPILPIVWGIRESIGGFIPISVFMALVANSAIYMIVGVLIFSKTVRFVKASGRLAHY
ncbi:MAG: hypothetical protein QM718_05715 [Steroidobacteraceae bacterium]